MPQAAVRPLVAVLTGPTGAGKSDWALRLAAEMPLEIVSVDSAQVYRGMDIGTAKPSPAERVRVPHHLIDLRDPVESYSAGEFAADARAAIEAIHARGRLPLLVGGTMLYLRALFGGIASLPKASPELRRSIDAHAAEVGWPALHAELARVDPEAAVRIHPNDPQRIQRALEVYHGTGVPISELQRRGDTGGAIGWDVRRWALVPARAHLHERIERRLQAMMAAGFLEEVRGLRDRGDLTAAHASMRAVGYRQLWAHLEGACSLAEAVRRAVAATRQLAKRQLTWLRAEPATSWIDPEVSATYEEWSRALVRTTAARG